MLGEGKSELLPAERKGALIVLFFPAMRGWLLVFLCGFSYRLTALSESREKYKLARFRLSTARHPMRPCSAHVRKSTSMQARERNGKRA